MGLFDPAWKTRKTSGEGKAIQSVEKISDPKALLEIAFTAPLGPVRKAAADRITDQGMLFLIALKGDIFLVGDAIDRIRDPKLLMRLAAELSHCGRGGAAGDAVERISDPELLKEMALRGDRDFPVQKAVSGIHDDSMLAEIGNRAAERSARVCAVGAIRDPDLLLEFAFSPDENIRHTARKSLKYQYIGEWRSCRGTELTGEQFERYIDSLIAESSRTWDIEAPVEADGEQLRRICREAARSDLRADAFSRLNRDPLPENLLELYKAAGREARAAKDPRDAKAWRDAQDRLIKNLDPDDAALLLRFVEDPEVDCSMAGTGIRMLFAEKLDGREGIEDMRDEAFRTFLERIPAWERENPHNDEKYAFWVLAVSLPESARSKYGFRVEQHEYEDEDQYGRYTSQSTTVEYQGKRYTVR